MGKPRRSGDAVANSTSQKADGRFTLGEYVFPFSFSFPTHPNALNEEPIPNASPISPFPTLLVGSIRNTSSSTFPLDEYASLETRKRQLSVSSPSPTDAEAIPFSPISPRSQPHLSLSCPLPQSFTEKGVNSTVSYDLLVRIDHGRFRGSSK